MTELVLDHVRFFNLLLHDHLVDLLLSDAVVFGLLITNFERERLGHSDSVATSALRFDS